MLKLAGLLLEEVEKENSGYCLFQGYCVHKDKSHCNVKPYACEYFHPKECAICQRQDTIE